MHIFRNRDPCMTKQNTNPRLIHNAVVCLLMGMMHVLANILRRITILIALRHWNFSIERDQSSHAESQHECSYVPVLWMACVLSYHKTQSKISLITLLQKQWHIEYLLRSVRVQLFLQGCLMPILCVSACRYWIWKSVCFAPHDSSPGTSLCLCQRNGRK